MRPALRLVQLEARAMDTSAARAPTVHEGYPHVGDDELIEADGARRVDLTRVDALEQVVGENRQETLFDERRLTRDASTAEFYESLFGAEDEDDALTKRRGGSFLKKEPVTPLSPPKTSCF